MASCRRRIIVLVTGARKLFCWAGLLEPVAGLEVFSRHLFRLPLLVHAVGAVLDHDVAEAAFLPAGNLGSRNCSDLWGSTDHQASHRGAAKHGICFASRLVPSNVNSYG